MGVSASAAAAEVLHEKGSLSRSRTHDLAMQVLGLIVLIKMQGLSPRVMMQRPACPPAICNDTIPITELG